MADKRPMTSVFRRLESDKTRKFPHLQPLSIYSRKIFCDGADVNSDELSWVPGSPFCKIRVKIRNSGASVSCKRQLEDSCLDETYETPKKKPCLSTCRSPDLACFIDSSSSEVKNVSAELSEVAEKVNNVVGSSPNKESPSELQVTPSLKCAGLFWTSSSDESDGLSSPSLSLSDIQSCSSPIAVSEAAGRRGPAFEFDVNDIMYLSPIDCNEGQLSSDKLDESCQTCHKEQQSRENSEACVGQKDESSKQIQGIVEEKGVKENDEGYFTICYKTPQPQSRAIHPAMSTPLDKFRQLLERSSLIKGLGKKAGLCSPIVNQEALKASSPISLYGSMNLDTSNTSPKASLLDSKKNREAEIRNVRTLIQKSLVCPSVQPAPVATDTVSHVKESKDVPSVRQVDTKFHVTFQEKTYPTENLEITPPLQVQEKSKLVLSSTQRPEVNTAPTDKVEVTAQQPERKPQSRDQKKDHRRVQRPVVFEREKDWEREKAMYVNSVVRHMKDNTGTGNGVMTELLHLMDTVANQENGRQWQHPSDLTHRNYQPRHSDRLISLDEWQKLNFHNHRRFAKVPQPFRRSSVY